MKLEELLKVLDAIAPLRYAESWDNVGLLAGDPAKEIRRALVTIDYTREVAHEAVERSCELVIAYHSPIFEAIKRVTAPSLVFDAISRGIAIYSPHTALDAAEGGTNDVLAGILGITEPASLRPVTPSPWHYKLVVFVPLDAEETVASALFAAGAGWIGDYSHCSFRVEGTGTFLGLEGTNPAVGTPGKLERAKETRIETIVPAAKLGAVVQALRQSHPYEEPAFDLIQLTAAPESKGIGRIGKVSPIPRAALLERIRGALGVSSLLVAGPQDGEVRTAACCAGSGGSLVGDALKQKADLMLTGEVRHHEALRAAAEGMTLVCALHSNSERVALPRYAQRIARETGIEVNVSKSDRDPFTIG